MLNFTITKRKLSSFIALLAFLQAGLWYGGLADLIPVALLNQWNRLTLIFSVILAFLCIARKREINIATTLIVLFKVILILSTYINGRTVDEVEFTRFLCIVLSLEYFEDELDSIVTVLMLVCELMVYYNLVTLSVGPDLYGAYYTALGYDNAAPPYLMAAYLVAICFALEKRKYIRTIILIVAIHATLLITMVGTGLVAVFFVDILLIWNLIKSIELTLIKTYVLFKHGFHKPLYLYFLQVIPISITIVIITALMFYCEIFLPLNLVGFIGRMIMTCIGYNVLMFVVYRKCDEYTELKKLIITVISGGYHKIFKRKA